MIFFLMTSMTHGQDGSRDGSWPTIGGGTGHSKYSSLSLITPGNVKDLRVAWTWTSIDARIQGENEDNPGVARASYFQCTPLMVDGALYVSTCLGQAAALDAETGETLWTYDPESWKAGRPPNLGYISRGVGYWDGDGNGRVFHVSGDSYLHCLDAATGALVESFGNSGRADLTTGVKGATHRTGYGHPSAPIVVNDMVVVGSSISDGAARKEGVPGRILAFDARTGELRWTFNIVPAPGEYGEESWGLESNSYSGGANVWANISADEEHGLVYLPTSTPTNDFYGGHRPGDNLFAESVVCLDAKTGRRVWHFQTVHHGLWDYDLPSAPNLVNITVDGEAIPAVAQISKQGFVYVLNRLTGKPVWPIEERPVSQSNVPGETASATQPFPMKPPPFTLQGATDENLNDLTPEIKERARAVLAEYNHGPLFTPPVTDRPTLILPGYGGGANWPGAAFDPETSILYVPSMNQPSVIMVGKPDPARSNFRYSRVRGGGVPAFDGLPLFKGPWAQITAIDLNRGEHVWQVPNGGRGPVDHPLLKDVDIEYLGTNARAATLVTKTLLIATEGSGRSGSASGGGRLIRFFDKRSGSLLHQIELPDDATGVPMTYSVDGKQFVVVAVGTTPAQLVALSL